MLRVGVIDDDASLVRSMATIWGPGFDVTALEARRPDLDAADVLIVDACSVTGHSLAILTQARREHPELKLVVTLVYCDETQTVETQLRGLADVCVLKPYDVDKLGQTLLYLAEGD